DHGGDLGLRMHPWFAICLVRSPAVVTVEERGDAVPPRNSAVLIRPFQLYGLRAVGEPGQGAVTLLLRGPDLEARGLPADAALVTDPALGERLAGLVSRVLPPGASGDDGAAERSLR